MHPCIFISSAALNRQNIFAKVSDIAVKIRFFCSALRLVRATFYPQHNSLHLIKNN